MMAWRSIYLIRHGETEWNRDGRQQGQLDSPLTPTGDGQARSAAAILNREIDDLDSYVFYCSPLGRARRTAEIICEALLYDPARIIFDPLLQEYSWGDWQGMTMAEMDQARPGAVAERARDKWNFKPPGGESYALLAARVDAWIQQHKREQNMIVVSHAAAGRVLRGRLLGLPPGETLNLETTQGVVFRCSPGKIDRLEPTPNGESGA